jgi:hypothetical protein
MDTVKASKQLFDGRTVESKGKLILTVNGFKINGNQK